jgi:type IV pilus assembly protein PilX
MRSSVRPLFLSSPSRSRGTVLAVVLVVLVIMMLGGVSMLRSVDTSALLSGNLAFKRDSVNHSAVGLNSAFKVMMSADFNNAKLAECIPTDPDCPNAVSQWLAMNYSPRLLEADANGVPLIIKDKTAFDAKFGIKPSLGDKTLKTTNENVRFLIERMCSDFGVSDEKKCSVSDRYERGGSYRQDKPGSISLPLYRITVRSDGVRNTQTYIQTTVTTRVK